MKYNDKWEGVDLFCGAGGSAEGILNSDVAEVKWAINHDQIAIDSHAANHPEAEHFNEDVIDFDVTRLPKKINFFWMSSECTHYSCAKGGDSRCPDSRTLPEQLFRYADWCNPDVIFVENVKEFLTWGPLRQQLDKDGKPMFKNGKAFMVPDTDADKLGIYYKQWVKSLREMGYVNYRWKLLDAADFGAYTSRVRYFGIFTKPGIKIRFPSPTHHKTGVAGYQKWKAVKQVLDFEDKGKSIFGRKKPLSENTLARIYAGLEKFRVKDENEFITITTVDGKSLVYLMKYHGKGENILSPDAPSSTITTKDRLGLIQCIPFLTKQYNSNGKPEYNNSSVDKPAGSLTTNPKLALVSPEQFIMKYHFGANPTRLNEVAQTIMAKRDTYLLSPEGFMMNHNYNNKPSYLENPCPTLLASRKHFYLVQMELGRSDLNEKQSMYTKSIIEFMSRHGIADIKMRMLKVSELKKIQGFPENYILKGSETLQKKFIGNSVHPIVAKALLKTMWEANNL
jgi:DNA (cytosine-5)-methyltransferase 1